MSDETIKGTFELRQRGLEPDEVADLIDRARKVGIELVTSKVRPREMRQDSSTVAILALVVELVRTKGLEMAIGGLVGNALSDLIKASPSIVRRLRGKKAKVTVRISDAGPSENEETFVFKDDDDGHA